MATGIRGIDPIWWVPDLTGLPLDDTYYLFVLQNDLPYIPATIYADNMLSTPLPNPLQFLANGTLPVNLFWDPTMVYRLEIRKGPTQYFPLIYLIEDYVPGTGGSGPITTVAFETDNQITNPQFSIVSFASPFTLTNVTNPSPIEVAPGWFLNLTGTGSVTLEQVPLNNDPATINPTNAPYALNINLSGSWTAAYLSQRFNQNGMLWANQTVSSSVTAKLEGVNQTIFSRLVDSNSTLLGLIAYDNEGIVTAAYAELMGFTTLLGTSNPDVPPAAYIEFQLVLPNATDMFLTSFQLVAGQIENNYEYEQDTIERQVDHTFHYYKPSILLQPKDSILTGWDFGLNPWQFTTTAQTNVAANGYTADQTIVLQQNVVLNNTPNNISVGQASFTKNQGLLVTAVTATNQFAIAQYIDPTTMMPYWSENNLSALVNLSASIATGTIPVKMRLLYRATLPPTIAQNEPVLSWTLGGEPVYTSGWTAITPENDPVYNIGTGVSTLTFNKCKLPVATASTMTLAIVIYTVGNMAAADTMTFNRVSLVPNDFSIETNPLTFDETLRRCQFYWEKSQNPGVLLSTGGIQGALVAPQGDVAVASVTYPLLGRAFGFQYKNIKRSLPLINLYSISGTINTVYPSGVNGFGTQLNYGSDVAVSNWTITVGSGPASSVGNNGVILLPVAAGPIISGSGPSSLYTTAIYYHYSAGSRMGVLNET